MGVEPMISYLFLRQALFHLSYLSSGFSAVSFTYSHYSDSANFSATYRINTLPLARDTSVCCFVL